MMQVARHLPSVSKKEDKIAKIVARMKQVSSSAPSKTTGSQLFARTLAEMVRGRKEADQDGYDAPMSDLIRHVFTRHGTLWAKLTMRHQANFSHRAFSNA